MLIYFSINKKEILTKVTEAAGKKINGKVTIEDVELGFFSTFPKMSVQLDRVIITDSAFDQHHHPFLSCDKVFAELSISKLIKKELALNDLKIENGAIYLFTDASGYTNEYLLKTKKDSAAAKNNAPAQNELKSIILKKIRLTIDDKNKGKLYDAMINNLNLELLETDSASVFSAKVNLLIHNLAFNLKRGSFVKEKTFEGKFDVRFDKKLQQLQFDSVDVKIADHPFNLTGRFDLTAPNPQFALRIHTQNILYDFAKTLLTPKIDTALSIVSLDNKIDADASISGPLKGGGDPFVVINWRVKKSNLITPFLNFNDASFTGFFTNEVTKGQPTSDLNSRININHFTAMWNGFPATSANIDILNLDSPTLTCDLESEFPLTALNDISGSNNIELKSGNGAINITYKGPVEKNRQTNSLVNGLITFNNGTVLFASRNVEMTNVNGKLRIKNSNVLIDNIQCVLLNNKIAISGKADNLITLMNTEPNKANIDLNIYSPSLNLTSFTYLLKSRRKIVDNNPGRKRLRNVTGRIDAVLDQGIVNINLKADKLEYKKFEGTNATANISLLQDRFLINNVSMQHGGGSMSLNAALINRKSNFHEATVNSSLNNVDVNKIFSSFNNFGQSGIEAQNIAGNLSAKVNISFGLNDDGKAYPASVAGSVVFSLKNGALINYEPLKKLESFLFKNRNFENVKFAELKDHMEISNEQIKINRMEIESSVLSCFVEGTYSKKGNTDISIQVPLSNLKKRNADYKPENIGTDKKIGRSLFIRARPGPDGKIEFKPDLFNKFGKEKKKEMKKLIE